MTVGYACSVRHESIFSRRTKHLKEKMQIGLNELKVEKESEEPATCCVDGKCTCETEDEEPEIEDEIED